MLGAMTTPATLLEFGAIGDVPSILEIELPAILFNESLYIELNGSVTLLDASGINQTNWSISNNITSTGSSSSLHNSNNSSGNSSSSANATSNITQLAEEEQRAANERAAAEFWLLVKMIAMAVVLGLMILVTIIGKYLLGPKSLSKIHSSRIRFHFRRI